MRALWQRIPAAIVHAVVALVLVVFLLAVGSAAPDHTTLVLLLALGVLAFGVSLNEPVFVPLLAMPLLLVLPRLSIAGLETSASTSDVALFVAMWPALVLCPRPFSKQLRTLLWLDVGYQAATLLTVVANPSRTAALEWFHEWVIVSGALVVGWAIGRRGRGSVALNLLLLAGAVIALSTIAQGLWQYAHGDFGAVYTQWPFGMQKNYVGTTMGMLAIIAYVHPPWLHLPRAIARGGVVVFVAAVLMSQSRQAMVALSIVVLVLLLARAEHHRRSVIAAVAAVPVLVLVFLGVRDQIVSGNAFNSANQRLHWFQDSAHVWAHDPIFGVGLRWWNTGRFPVAFQPPQAEIEVLTSAGLIGVVAFLVLLIGGLVVLWRLSPAYGTLAFAVLLNRVLQSQFDIFWVGAGVSPPFVVVGICLGAAALADDRARSRRRYGDRKAALL